MSSASHVTQLSTLLSEPPCRLTKPIEIDYNFTEVEHQYLFDVAGKRFIKENGSLKRSLQAFIRYECKFKKSESSNNYRRYTFSLYNIIRFQTANFEIK